MASSLAFGSGTGVYLSPKGDLVAIRSKNLMTWDLWWDVYDHQWQQGIHKLQEYKSEIGGVMVPWKHETPDGFKLGMWVASKRVAKSKGKLSSDQIKELDDLGFVWDAPSWSSACCGIGNSAEKTRWFY